MSFCQKFITRFKIFWKQLFVSEGSFIFILTQNFEALSAVFTTLIKFTNCFQPVLSLPTFICLSFSSTWRAIVEKKCQLEYTFAAAATTTGRQPQEQWHKTSIPPPPPPPPPCGGGARPPGGVVFFFFFLVHRLRGPWCLSCLCFYSQKLGCCTVSFAVA